MRIVLIDTAYLGDLVLASPLIRASAGIASNGRVAVLTSPAGSEVVRHHPLVETLFVLDKRGSGSGAGGFLRAREWLRRGGFGAALLPRRSMRSALLAATGGVRRRIGFARGAARLLFTEAIPFRPDRHQVERNLDLLRPLGVDPETCGLPGHPLEVFPAPEEREAADAWLAERALTAAGSFVALAPGSAWLTKRWPVDRFARLAARLSAEGPVVVIGGEEERALARRIQAEAEREGRGSRVHDATGLLSASGSAHLLRRAAVLVANDSGALHLGQAAGVPIVALYGPTSPALGYAPRGGRVQVVEIEGLPCRPCGRHGAARCPQGHWRCMLDIDPERVRQAVAELSEAA